MLGVFPHKVSHKMSEKINVETWTTAWESQFSNNMVEMVKKPVPDKTLKGCPH